LASSFLPLELMGKLSLGPNGANEGIAQLVADALRPRDRGRRQLRILEAKRHFYFLWRHPAVRIWEPNATLAEQVRERELERALIDHLRDFLLELGIGFSFVGSQHRLEVGGQEFRLDLLFYHLRLRAFVVIEVKVADFQPEFSGKMNFYLSAVHDLLGHPDDQPSIGIILCKSKNKIVAEYALRDIRKPVGISEYRITAALPKRLQGSLPTIEELEAELKEEGKK